MFTIYLKVLPDGSGFHIISFDKFDVDVYKDGF